MKGKSRRLYNILHDNATLRQLLKNANQQNHLDSTIRPLLPEAMLPHYLGNNYKNGELTLFVDNAVWASQLRFLIPALKKQLSQKNYVIHRINQKIMITSLSARKERKELPKISEENAQMLSDTADALDHQRLAAALRKLGKHT